MASKKMTLGLIVGNRGFFPDHLAKTGREEILRVLQSAGMDVVALTPEESKYGAVETRIESHRCAELFKRNRERIDGIIVTLPNFGTGTSNAPIRSAGGPARPGAASCQPTIKKMTIAAATALRKMSASATMPVWNSSLLLYPSHRGIDSAGIRQRPTMVCCRLPGSQWIPQPPSRRNRRASYRIQYCPL
jgi:L-fucose isomerase-like protein